MKQRIVNILSEHGVMADPEVVDHLAKAENPLEHLDLLLKAEEEPPLFLTMDVLQQLEEALVRKMEEARRTTQAGLKRFEEGEPDHVSLEGDGGEGAPEGGDAAAPPATTGTGPGEGPVITPGTGLLAPDFSPTVTDIAPEIKVIQDITNRSTCEGELSDFVRYFKSRYNKLKKMLRNRLEMRSSTSIEYLKDKRLPGEVKVIGMVSEVRTAPWGGVIITVEDDTSDIKAVLGKEETVVNDEVVGLVGKFEEATGKWESRLKCKTLVRPGIMTNRAQGKSKDAVHALFISDIHLGSTTFLHKQWRNFIRWLNGHIDAQRRLAGNIKYLVINGDIVDGIGIYPNQDEELEIKDIYAQYEELARHLGDIPKHIQMIILPGNHDAVRPAEPQPTFPEEITKLFPSNCTFVGNPCSFTIHGVEVLAYHGRSMDDLIPALKLNYEQPMKVMERMLHMRHLCPMYGARTAIAPERDDILVIDRVPDIFVTGHLHKTDVKNYRNVLMIQASTWQAQTTFQRMMNIKPDPAKAVAVDLQTLSAKRLNFAG